MQTHTYTFFIEWLLLCSPWQESSLHHGHCPLFLLTSLLRELTSFTTLRENKPCFFLSQKNIFLCFYSYSSHFVPGSAFILLLTFTLLSSLFLLVGEPSWSQRNGNHPPDLRGHIRTYICHGWESRIPHKGRCEFPCVPVHAWNCAAVAQGCTQFWPYDTFSGNSARASNVILTWMCKHQ